jgi:hypothetical protein
MVMATSHHSLHRRLQHSVRHHAKSGIGATHDKVVKVSSVDVSEGWQNMHEAPMPVPDGTDGHTPAAYPLFRRVRLVFTSEGTILHRQRTVQKRPKSGVQSFCACDREFLFLGERRHPREQFLLLHHTFTTHSDYDHESNANESKEGEARQMRCPRPSF